MVLAVNGLSNTDAGFLQRAPSASHNAVVHAFHKECVVSVLCDVLILLQLECTQ